MNAPETKELMHHAAVPLALRDTPVQLPARLVPTEKLVKHLVETGCISSAELQKARHIAWTHRMSVPDTLVSEGWLAPDALLTARCTCFGATRVRLDHSPPDKALLLEMGVERCLRHKILPWRRMGGRVIWVTSAPEQFDHIRPDLPHDPGNQRMHRCNVDSNGGRVRKRRGAQKKNGDGRGEKPGGHSTLRVML